VLGSVPELTIEFLSLLKNDMLLKIRKLLS
jgi:hypothetical protein